jgi:predicted flap endonuclease-1-like 5' DNA nuclease
MYRSFKKGFAASILITLILAGCASEGTQNLIAPVINQNTTNEDADYQISRNGYKLDAIIGIGPVYQDKLNYEDIKNTDQLLAATAKRLDREKLAAATGISHKLILTWANHVDLMRLKGIGPKQSNWLEAVGVDSIKELAQRRADNLHAKLEFANYIDPKKSFVHRMPSVSEVQGWIDLAAKTKPAVEE